MRLLCDEMFGSLARWLRMMGHDVLYPRDLNDDDIIAVAREEDRFILTRDRDMHRRYPRSLYIHENHLEDQLRVTIDTLNLEIMPEKSRCSSCNGLLARVGKEEVAGRVPPHTFQTQEEFFLCQDCEKIFWRGSHWERIDALMRSLSD